MLPTVLRSKKKERKKEGERKKMMMKSSSVPLASSNSKYFEDYSILNYSNHVQSDNKDFSFHDKASHIHMRERKEKVLAS